eukprot:gnl/Hemi2/8631_TR2993_c0_g1_i1.p1 gnl/Hemi2/8631_TR2993_c0_g1~~gnl/Hemi2/8631_TR2993_c0_g1_i1.p1  ORF type:complete len:192 (-),score=25.38 gnl/Hemi2/8631_TR2993_c0_g1_i1:75-650(-)
MQPVIEGDCFLLRPLILEDAKPLFEATGRSMDPVLPKTTSIEWPFSTEAAVRLINKANADWQTREAARFVIIEPSLQTTGSPPFISGTASLLHIYPGDAEIGYWLRESCRGRGLVTRVVSRLCDWGFSALALPRLHILTDFDNTASSNVALKCGFVKQEQSVWWTDPRDGSVVECLRFNRANPFFSSTAET